jgi:hypothetical protein
MNYKYLFSREGFTNGLLFLISPIFAVFFGFMAIRDYNARTWPQTIAYVAQEGTKTISSRTGTHYSFKVSYQVDNKNYNELLIFQELPGSTVSIAYDPKNPGDCIKSQELKNNPMIWSSLAILISMTGIYFGHELYKLVKQKNPS